MGFSEEVWSQVRRVGDGPFSFDVRGGARSGHAERCARTPEWATDNTQVQALLLRVFPKMMTEGPDREGAKRWIFVIQLYFRAGFTSAQTASALELEKGYLSALIGREPFSHRKIRSTITRIRNAAKGLRTDGAKPTGRKRGRPKGTTVANGAKPKTKRAPIPEAAMAAN
jgi:hypothetical protein